MEIPVWRMYYEVKDFTKLLGKKTTPMDSTKKTKCINNDEARGLIEMSISSDL
jgi:hypothetical protein